VGRAARLLVHRLLCSFLALRGVLGQHSVGLRGGNFFEHVLIAVTHVYQVLLKSIDGI
jgi:hypothetical protein